MVCDMQVATPGKARIFYGMRMRTFDFRTVGVRGLPAVILGALFALVLAVIVALVAVVGMALSVGGLIASSVAMIADRIRRHLSSGQQTVEGPPRDASDRVSVVRNDDAIEVEVLSIREGGKESDSH